MDYNDVVRTSDTVVTITLGAESTYDITATETITVIVPATALAGAAAILAAPQTIAITPVLPFDFRKSITIDRTKVGASGTAATTLTNVPTLYSVTDVNLKTRANDPTNGRVETANGWDILFRATDDATCGGTGPCTLDHEVEKYDATTGELVAWVKVPSVNTNAASSDTVIYIYYGNAAISQSLESATGVWDANHKGVWHLLGESPDDSVAGHDDSTSQDNDGTPQNFQDGGGGSTNAAGAIAGADEFAGDDDYVDLGTGCRVSSAWTVSFWVHPSAPANFQRLFLQGTGACASRQVMLYWHTDHIEMRTDTGGAAGVPQAATSALTDATWSQVTWDV